MMYFLVRAYLSQGFLGVSRTNFRMYLNLNSNCWKPCAFVAEFLLECSSDIIYRWISLLTLLAIYKFDHQIRVIKILYILGMQLPVISLD